MNLLESIYCYLHSEKLKENQPLSHDTTTGNILVTLSIIMLIFGSFFLVITISPSASDAMEDFLKSIFGRNAGRLIGQFLIFILLIIIYPIVIKTIGTQENFERIAVDFLKMSEIEKERVAKKGKIFFLVCLFTMVIPIFLKAIIG